ncbi:hypothetical protein BJV74DRAFT_886570 [Russula compacta]|nr:hypothetical protein BJV74DRAFT_886570 [Russula compacta]
MFLCGPSRLVWFGIGSVATWAWIHHHEHHHQRHHHDPDHNQWGWGCHRRVEYRGGRAQWEREEAAGAATGAAGANASASADYGEQQQRRQIAPSLTRDWRREPAAAVRVAGAAEAQAPPAPPSAVSSDQDNEHLRQIGRNAEEAISGMSEATIDGVMGALQRLKDRLVERRTQQQWTEIESQRSNSTPASPPEQPRHTV